MTSIQMTKTPCFGSCPSYRVRFTADGVATYHGGRFAPRQGRYTAIVDFPAIAAWVATQHPETLNDRYAGNSIDTQVVGLRIDWGHRRKTVETSREEVAPLRFEGILLALDGLSERLRWRRDDTATPFLGGFSRGATGLYIDADLAGRRFVVMGPPLSCGRTRQQVTVENGTMRVRCGPRASVLHAVSGGLHAEGDATPAGFYGRVTPQAAVELMGTKADPRMTE